MFQAKSNENDIVFDSRIYPVSSNVAPSKKQEGELALQEPYKHSSGKVIIPLNVREILDEEIARKSA